MFNPIEIIFCVVLSAVLTVLGSRWIDRLYAREDAPLSFPDDISARSRFRRPLLSIGLFICILLSVKRTPIEAPYLIAASFFLLLITATDFEQYVIFDRMTLPFAVVGLISALHLQLPLVDRLMAGLIGGAGFLLLAVATRGSLGGGDIKLIAALGLWFGTERLLDIVVCGSIFGGVAALFLLLSKKMNRKSVFAYGPYFALTALCFLLAQPQ